MFADRMKEIDPDSKYADTVERELYNGALAGLSLDGKAFFYENPLEINLADHHRHTSVTDEGDTMHVQQMLQDEEDFNDWSIDFDISLNDSREAGIPLLKLAKIGEV